MNLGMKSRKYSEFQQSCKDDYELDRNRIIQCDSFKKLGNKTQVFLTKSHDNCHTRLTHTLKVAVVSRKIAKFFQANEILAEAIALAHDIGHPPYGHCGEYTLQNLMWEYEGDESNGFDHNVQRVRIVEYLERASSDYCGLNLTWGVRAGLRKYLPPIFSQSIEAQIVSVADDAVWLNHDIEDGLKLNVITKAQLNDLELWRLADASKCSILDLEIENILNNSKKQMSKMSKHDPINTGLVVQHKEKIIDFSKEMKNYLLELKKFLYENIYFNDKVFSETKEAGHIIEKLFKYYVYNPNKIGGDFKKRIGLLGLYRSICDYIVSMSERYIEEEYRLRFK
jgi:dGTPase